MKVAILCLFVSVSVAFKIPIRKRRDAATQLHDIDVLENVVRSLAREETAAARLAAQKRGEQDRDHKLGVLLRALIQSRSHHNGNHRHVQGGHAAETGSGSGQGPPETLLKYLHNPNYPNYPHPEAETSSGSGQGPPETLLRSLHKPHGPKYPHPEAETSSGYGQGHHNGNHHPGAQAAETSSGSGQGPLETLLRSLHNHHKPHPPHHPGSHHHEALDAEISSGSDQGYPETPLGSGWSSLHKPHHPHHPHHPGKHHHEALEADISSGSGQGPPETRENVDEIVKRVETSVMERILADLADLAKREHETIQARAFEN